MTANYYSMKILKTRKSFLMTKWLCQERIRKIFLEHINRIKESMNLVS